MLHNSHHIYITIGVILFHHYNLWYLNTFFVFIAYIVLKCRKNSANGKIFHPRYFIIRILYYEYQDYSIIHFKIVYNLRISHLHFGNHFTNLATSIESETTPTPIIIELPILFLSTVHHDTIIPITTSPIAIPLTNNFIF